LAETGFYAALLHRGNTNPYRTTGKGWTRVDIDVPRRLLGEDWAFYDDLSASGEPSTVPPAKPRTGASLRRPSRAAPTGGRESRPLVSCIMPTGGRSRFLPQAISYFLRQDYPARELVIVDDSPEDARHLIPDDDRIRYLHLPAGVSAGRKRNLAVEHSRGEWIAHWDDDDWYAPDRLSVQVAPLAAGQAEICGFGRETFYDVRQDRFWRCSPGLHARMFFADVHGRSIVYRRALWRRLACYPDAYLGEDARFLRRLLAHGKTLARLPGDEKLVYVRHGANTWRFRCGEYLDPGAWESVRESPFLPAEDLAFYRDMGRSFEPS
jgi:glycosyltransferase involved in cell wall biosynthesis